MAQPTDASKPYQLVGAPIHRSQWDEGLQRVIPGWAVTARWLANGSVIHVFVPDTADLAATSDALIRFQGQQLDDLSKLGA